MAMTSRYEHGVVVCHQGHYVVIDCQDNWTYGDESSATIFSNKADARQALTDSYYDEVIDESDEPVEFLFAARLTNIEAPTEPGKAQEP